MLRRWWRARRLRSSQLTSEAAPTAGAAVDAAEAAAADAVAGEVAAGLEPDVAAESAESGRVAERRSAPPPWPQRERTEGEAEPVTIGVASTFGSADWWTTDWWPLSSSSGDVVADCATIGSLAVAGATLRGNKHRLSGEPGEDSFHLRSAKRPTGEHVACIAVCDGVGSASRSRDGARWLSRAVTYRLAMAVEEGAGPLPLSAEATRIAITSAIQEVRELAVRRSIDIATLQTTLAFAVVSDGGTAARAVAGQIGDSPVFIGTADGLRPAIDSLDTDGPILTTATHDALSASPETLRLAVFDLAPGDRLMACSDGVGNFLWSSAGALDLGHHLNRALWGPVPQLEFIRQVGFDLRSADDDRTLVVLWTRALPLESPT